MSTGPASPLDMAQVGQSESELMQKHKHSTAAYWIMVLLGAGLLEPWNAVVNAVDYFDTMYEGGGYEFYVGAAYVWPQLPFVIGMVKYGDKVSFSVRIVSMFILQGLLLVMIPVISHTVTPDVSFWLNLTWIFLIGVSTAILQPSLFGFSSQLPPIYNQAIMAGQGVAGVSVSFMRIGTKFLMPDPKKNALLFFAVSCMVLVACVVGYYYILRMDFTQYHLERAMTTRLERSTPKSSRSRGTTPSSAANTPLLEDSPSSMERGVLPPVAGASGRTGTYKPKPQFKRVMTLRMFLSKKIGLRTKDSDEPELMQALVHEEEDEPEAGSCGHFLMLTRQMWMYAFGVSFIFVVTFAVFPGEISSIAYRGTYKALDSLGGQWWPIILITAFNCCDLTGRTTAGFYTPKSPAFVAIGSSLRLVFVPLFVLAVYNTQSKVFTDLFVFLMVVCYGLSNGYIASVGMMRGPSMVAPHNREAAGFFMSLWLQGGMFVGALAALGVKQLRF